MMTRPGIRNFPEPSADAIYPGSNGIAWDCVAQASWESFPASDAPSWMGRRLDKPAAQTGARKPT
jgi:hypothetical protein